MKKLAYLHEDMGVLNGLIGLPDETEKEFPLMTDILFV